MRGSCDGNHPRRHQPAYTSPAISEPLKLTLALVDAFVEDNPIDADRVYVVGMSMGGYWALDAVQRS